MNTDSETTRQSHHPQQLGWRESLASLVSCRIEIIQTEFKQVIRERSRDVLALAAAGACLFFTWALLVAGGIASLASATDWPWHFITLIAAAIHLLVAIALIKFAKSAKAPTFPVTRAEFQKDREWIDHLQKKKPVSRN